MDSEDEDDFVPIYEQDSEPDREEEASADQDDASDTDGSSSNSEYDPEADAERGNSSEDSKGADDEDLEEEEEGDELLDDVPEANDPGQAEMDDEAAYLTGASGGETDIEGGMDSDGASDLFDGEFDPMEALSMMEGDAWAGGASSRSQPYQVLAHRRRAAQSEGRGARRGGDGSRRQSAAQQQVFGAGVDDIDALLNPKARRGGRRQRKTGKKPGGQPLKLMSQEAEAALCSATLLYASGRNDEALAQLMEVVRLSPNAAEPYHTIGTIYEAKGNPRKALDFYMIAAHLPPKDLDLWRRLASMSTEQGFLRQAIYCLNKVVHGDRTDVHAQWDRAVLYTDLGHHKRAIAAFERIHDLRPGDAEVTKVLSRLYFRTKDVRKATALLEHHIATYPAEVDLTHVNILAELQMDVGEHGRAAATIQHAAAALCPDGQLPIDLQVKAGMCALRQGEEAAATESFQALLAEDAAEYADLLLQVAQLWLDVGRPADAQPYFQAVHGSGSPLDDASVWAALATGYRTAGQIDEAIQLYQNILQGLEPGSAPYTEATLALANLLCEVGHPGQASSLLLHADGMDMSAAGGGGGGGGTKGAGGAGSGTTGAGGAGSGGEPLPLTLRRAQLLLQLGQDEAFLNTMMPAVEATMDHYQAADFQAGELPPAVRKALRRRDRRKAMLAERGLSAEPRDTAEEQAMFQEAVARSQDRRKAHIKKADAQAEALAAMTDLDTDGEGDEGGGVLTGVLRDSQQIELLISTARALVRVGRLDDALHLCNRTLDLFAKRWMDKSKRDSVRMVAAEVHLQRRALTEALQAVKAAAVRWPHSRVVWNCAARVLAAIGAIGHTAKFVRTQRAKHPTSVPLMLLSGHICSAQAVHGDALTHYFHAYRHAPQHPLTLLCLAVAFLNQAMSRKVGDRHEGVLRGFAFLREYSTQSQRPQEAAYNMGRAAHQLGLLHLAVPLYETALRETGNSAATDLRREAAHNLALIYKRSGAHALARRLLRQHFTV